MSSELLNQAIVDCQALKEVALKNAESLVLEKYADKIKEAVDSMLEKDDEDTLGDLGSSGDVGGLGSLDDMGSVDQPLSQVAEDVPLAATGGEKLCQCPEEDEEIEIDFGELENQMLQEPSTNTPDSLGAMPMPSADEKMATGDETEDEYELKEEDLTTLLESLEDKQQEEVVEEEKECDKEDVEPVKEELEVDVEPVKSGWKDVSGSKSEINMDMALAKAQDSKYKEEIAKLMKAKEEVQKKLNEANNIVLTMGERQHKLKEENNKNKLLLEKASKSIKKLALSNSKLMYSNRVYKDSSLNERQKIKIAESLSKANTVDEVKVIYESLSNTVGVLSSNKKTTSKESLSEAVHRPSTGMMFQRNVVSDKKEGAVTRMQVLAGIKQQQSKGDK